VFRFEPENKQSIFIKLASLKSLYLAKFRVSTLDDSHHLLVKLSLQKRLWKSRCYKWTVCSIVFVPNIALDQEAIVADIVLALFIFTRFWCTPTHTFNRIRAATRDVAETETAYSIEIFTSTFAVKVLRDRNLVKTRRSRLHQTIRDSRLENLWIMPIFFLKMSSPLRNWIFFDFVEFFLPALVVSHLRIQQTKDTLNYRHFAMPYRWSIKSLKQ